ncbi:MAG: aspartate aminotransferase family protein [Halanaeroarchaeum sp.]
MEPLFANFPKVPSASPYRCEFCDGDDGRECGIRAAEEVENVILAEGPESVAAFIAEPVTGAANAGESSHDGYFERVREITERHDVLLIVDEVMTGFGRTGKNFGIDHWGVTPDIITGAKGMSGGYTPVGGAMAHDRVVDVFEDLDGGFQHGHTYSFNPTSAAIGTAVLEYVRDHDLVANAAAMGEHLEAELRALEDFAFVGDVRGKGLMWGVEFVEPGTEKAPLESTGATFQNALFDAGLDNGILTYPSGGHVENEKGDHTLVTPPLTIDEAGIAEIGSRLRATLEQVQDELAL